MVYYAYTRLPPHSQSHACPGLGVRWLLPLSPLSTPWDMLELFTMPLRALLDPKGDPSPRVVYSLSHHMHTYIVLRCPFTHMCYLVFLSLFAVDGAPSPTLLSRVDLSPARTRTRPPSTPAWPPSLLIDAAASAGRGHCRRPMLKEKWTDLICSFLCVVYTYMVVL